MTDLVSKTSVLKKLKAFFSFQKHSVSAAGVARDISHLIFRGQSTSNWMINWSWTLSPPPNSEEHWIGVLPIKIPPANCRYLGGFTRAKKSNADLDILQSGDRTITPIQHLSTWGWSMPMDLVMECKQKEHTVQHCQRHNLLDNNNWAYENILNYCDCLRFSWGWTLDICQAQAAVSVHTHTQHYTNIMTRGFMPSNIMSNARSLSHSGITPSNII